MNPIYHIQTSAKLKSEEEKRRNMKNIGIRQAPSYFI